LKEIITSWILLLAMVILFFVNANSVKTLSEDMYESAEMLGKSIENGDMKKSCKEISEIKEKWKKSCKKLFHIYPHTQLEDIEKLILMTEAQIKNKEFNDAALRIEEIKYRIHLLTDNEKITLDNIF